MSNKVYYIGFYGFGDKALQNQHRTYSSAAVNLMNYISTLLSGSCRVEIFSPSWTLNTSGFYSSEQISLEESIQLHLPPSIGGKSRVTRFISKFISQAWLFYKIIRYIKKRDKVIVYHSIANTPVILLTKKIIRYHLVLQLNEIYQDVHSLGTFNNYFEHTIIQSADSYIFSTILLNRVIKNSDKKYIVCEGVLKMNPVLAEKYDDGKIHLVYAGLIDKIKLCAFISMELGKYLSGRYVIHIAGFGSVQDLEELKAGIAKNNAVSDCKIVFEGFLEGSDLFKLLQSCHLGLVAQAQDQAFTNTSFPSKIYTYLTNYLPVICLSNELILASPVAGVLYLYKENNPALIAELIQKISFSRESEILLIDRVNKINQQFENELMKIVA